MRTLSHLFPAFARKKSSLFLLPLLLLAGCGGGSTTGSMIGSPNALLSTTTLSFGNEAVGASSQPLMLTLTDSGTAALSITNIMTSANFAETNDCGSTLASGTNCTITVTFNPTVTGQLQGTISVNDNASGSPQTASLSGLAVTGTPVYTLTGNCWGGVKNGAPQQCGIGQDAVQCPVGEVVSNPETVSGCLPPQSQVVDMSTTCGTEISGGRSISGNCVAQVTETGGSCSVQGQECGAPQLPPCCSGLQCVPASTRAFCQPQ